MPATQAAQAKVSKRASALPKAARTTSQRPWIGLADGAEVAPVPSPARSLQRRLSAQLTSPSAHKWSRRKTMLFVLVVCGGFWTTVGLAVAAAFH